MTATNLVSSRFTLPFDQFMKAASFSPALVVDTEGTGLRVKGPCPESHTMGIALSCEPSPGNIISNYFPFKHLQNNLEEAHLKYISDVITHHPNLVYFNAKHDIPALADWDIYPQGNFIDLLVWQHFIDENLPSKKLDWLCNYHGIEGKIKNPVLQQIQNTFGWLYSPVDLMTEYATQDAFAEYQLYRILKPKFKPYEHLWPLEQKFIKLLIKMEYNGIKIDQDFCREQVDIGNDRMEQIVKELGVVPAGNALEDLILNKLELPVVRLTDGGKSGKKKPSFDKIAMEIYDKILSRTNNKTAQLIVAYRGWQKTISACYQSYLDLVYPDGRVRTNFALHRAVTTRLAAEGPALHQIPKTSDPEKKPWNARTRQSFIAEDGYKLWSIDESNLELRINTTYSKEPALVKAFDEGLNPFEVMASDLLWDYDNCKTFVYATSYGAGDDKIALTFGITDSEAKKMKKEFYTRYPEMLAFTNRCTNIAENIKKIKLWTGRVRHLPNPRYAYRAANSVMQGGAAELIKMWMVELDEAGLNNNECKMLLQIHDEIVNEIEEGKESIYLPEIKNIMEKAPEKFTVPFKVKAKIWGE